ncbi:MAG: hypothetical protein K0S68_480 [Candidatus Saccharibacteria bacterium]|jgi:gamma-glutamylcyclotransferase (GGCT)/AIG2-like uncharacterized protein YtfP|nr:hypothetical protein [Candidatus Saccharibacteria bacterium]
MFYFAFGSNMDAAQMERRCPGSVPVGRARLDGYALQFDGRSKKWNGAAANAVRKPGSSVWGTLYEVAPAHLDSLDRFEGIQLGLYRRETVKVERPGYGVVEAVVYVRDAAKVGAPNVRYLYAMVKGAAMSGLPIGYIAGMVRTGSRL